MKSLKNLLAVAAGFFLLVACNAERESIPAEELYYRNFIKKYGLIDTDHNWSLATNQNITVKGARGMDVKIYADFSGKRHLVADYSAIADNATLTFDVPAEVKTVIARVGATSYTVNIGETLNASGSRVINEVEWNGMVEVQKAPQKVFEVAPLLEMFEVYPEDSQNSGISINNLTNHGTNSFYFIADGEFHTFYPFYWYSDSKHTLGIYCIGEDGNVRFRDLYCSKSGELENATMYNPGTKKGDPHQAGETYLVYTANTEEAVTTWPEGIFRDKECTQTGFSGNGWWDEPAKLEYEKEGIYEYTEDNAIYFTHNGYVSRIHFGLPAGNTKYPPVIQIYETSTTDHESEFDVPDADNFKKCGSPGAYLLTESSEGANDNAKYIRTHGIKYRVKKDTPYGFYIKVYNTNAKLNEEGTDYSGEPLYTTFSHSTRNKEYGIADGTNSIVRSASAQRMNTSWWTDYNSNPDNAENPLTEVDAYSYASYYTLRNGQRKTIFGFEDWPTKSDFSADLNDIMFFFDDGTAPTHVVDEKDPEDPVGDPVTWTIAVEDLGETDDYDFNDLVLSIEYVSGQRTATIKALAAGGVYPIYVKYRDKFVDKDGNHVNLWLNEPDPTKMVNTYAIDPEHQHKDGFTIDLDEADTSINDIFKHLTILVHLEGEDKEVHEIGNTVRDKNSPENCGKAPLLILVTDDWEWPIERHDIVDCYPRFSEWVSDRNKTDWYKDNKNSTVRR